MPKRDKSQTYRIDENTVYGGIRRSDKEYSRIQASGQCIWIGIVYPGTIIAQNN